MFCSQCGGEQSSEFRFCSSCGAALIINAIGNPPTPPAPRARPPIAFTFLGLGLTLTSIAYLLAVLAVLGLCLFCIISMVA